MLYRLGGRIAGPLVYGYRHGNGEDCPRRLLGYPERAQLDRLLRQLARPYCPPTTTSPNDVAGTWR
jgi:hypothetical protein